MKFHKCVGIGKQKRTEKGKKRGELSLCVSQTKKGQQRYPL
ncbi:hypothetical protein [Vibrio vulnificus]|nr:hypothetical protein [Vibrio vulnificus]